LASSTLLGWLQRPPETCPRRRSRLVLDTLVGLVAWLTFLTRESTEDEVLEPAVDLIVSGIGSRG
jgi:hypothetical protein